MVLPFTRKMRCRRRGERRLVARRAGPVFGRLVAWLLLVVAIGLYVALNVELPVERQSLMDWLMAPFRTPQGWA